MKFSLLFVVVVCSLFLLTSTVYAQVESKQVIIYPNDIQEIKAYGQYNDPAYTNYYKINNLFDNAISQDSWWSQYGKSGFSVALKQPIEQICNVDIEVAQTPQNSPFILALNDRIFNGTLNSNMIKPDFGEECVKNVQTIKMDINEASTNKSNKLAELRLFTYINVSPPPPEPHICGPNEHWDETLQQCVPNEEPQQNMTKVTISNTKAQIDVSNSEITLNLGENTKLNLPNLNVPIQKVEVPKPIIVPQEDEDDDKKDKKDKKDD